MGASWALGSFLGSSWVSGGSPGALLGSILGLLGASWGPLGALPGAPGSLLGRSWGLLGPFWGSLWPLGSAFRRLLALFERISSKIKRTLKNIVFSMVLASFCGPRGSQNRSKIAPGSLRAPPGGLLEASGACLERLRGLLGAAGRMGRVPGGLGGRNLAETIVFSRFHGPQKFEGWAPGG